MYWIWIVLLLATEPVYAQVDGCTYHHRSGDELDGNAVFNALSARGCTVITFVLYQPAPRGEVRFDQVPCNGQKFSAAGPAW
jgi:hypothetical protein